MNLRRYVSVHIALFIDNILFAFFVHYITCYTASHLHFTIATPNSYSLEITNELTTMANDTQQIKCSGLF